MPFVWMKLLFLFVFWNTDEIVVSGLENLASNKPTRQTSEYGGGRFSSKAVDRGDRLRNFTVSVWQYDPGPHIKYNMVDTEYCICVHYPNTAESGTWTNLTCTKICLGRFVLFVLNNQEALTICELEIFGDIYNGCPTQYLPEMNIKKVVGKRSSPPNCTLLPYEVTNVYECIHQCLQMNNCTSFNYGPNLINTVNCQLVRCFSHPKEDFTVDSDWNWRYLSR
ncbi:hypothetical protein LOTGIDRAFT_162980 [Lottia gigantea]|uniref:Apple domain-containing protein n=1 Tax=Lottia gigantea TaxID=225164 RepID=V4A5K9_LOTGI|nr:hypothetical protein LOTGIDRAFT_162980 [Lottia gigantea]ESO91977.1 hypothetical protein LOTGIDRAFT_162980 [Lottia gigantea]